MLTSLKRGSVTGQALSSFYLNKVRFPIASSIYSISDNCVRESTLENCFFLYRSDPGSIPSKGTGNILAMLYFVMAIVRPVKRDWAVLSKDTPLDISI